jgi:ectoine hydroxylase-related dioxygenase (phytanoyl-CoA dioxygenase family)
MNDLSRFHKPIGDLFPAAKDDTSNWALSAEQVEFFRDHGYIAGIPVLDQDQLEALRVELASLMSAQQAANDLWYEFHSNESSDPNTELFHALGSWRISPAFHDLLWHPAVTVPARQLLGGAPRFWHDQLFCKPAHHGGVVAWHQDYSYWTRTTPIAHLTCWIGLDDSDEQNGCLQYIPRSHRWTLLPITGLAGDMTAIRRVLTDEQWSQLSRPLPIVLKAGECAFHHPLMVHGSLANRTASPRRATVINLVRDGVTAATDEPLLEGVPPLRVGEPLDGAFFPLLA